MSQVSSVKRRILISAIEPSADQHAARLLAETDGEYFGLGGACCIAQGLKLLPGVHMDKLAVMGFVEVLGALPHVLNAYRALIRAAVELRPDQIILVDYPGMHIHVAKKLIKLGMKVTYYIPPKVWIWRAYRVKILQKCDLVICIFPFEAEWLKARGVRAVTARNPILSRLPEPKERQEMLVLMPGSRLSEVKRHTRVMLDAAKLVIHQRPMRIVVPCPQLSEVRAYLAQFDVECLEVPALELLAESALGIIKSGTSSLEAACALCPHVVIYKTHPVTLWLFKMLSGYKSFISLPNLIAGKNIVPELIGNAATPARIAETLLAINNHKQQEAFRAIVKQLEAQ